MKNEEMFARGVKTNQTPINKGDNKRKIITIILGVVLMVLLIGVSYAVWRYTFTGSANTIETSKIELELLESTDEIIRVENALPMSDDQGKSQTKTFNFAVTTKTKAVQDIGYSLKIEKLSVDSGYTNLNDNQIKVYLTDYNNASLLEPTLVSDLSNYVLYGKTNSHNNTVTEIQDKYKLRVWIDSDVLVNDWNESTKLQYKFKIGVGEKGEVNTTSVIYSWLPEEPFYIGDPLERISSYTTDYTSLGYDFFLKHNIGSDGTIERNDVCYILSGTLYCLKGCGLYNGSYDGQPDSCELIYYEKNKATLLSSFGEEKCSINTSYIRCENSDFVASANNDGYIGTGDSVYSCFVDYDGYAYLE